MSHVTNVILTFAITEDAVEQEKGPDHYPVLDALQGWLAETQHGRMLAEVGDHAGGYKAFEAPLYAFAGNYLDVEEFVRQVRALPWEYPESVQVWIQGQDDERFTEYGCGAPAPAERPAHE